MKRKQPIKAKLIYLVSCFSSFSGEHEDNSMSVLMSFASLKNVEISSIPNRVPIYLKKALSV
jgi:hypothetical protein